MNTFPTHPTALLVIELSLVLAGCVQPGEKTCAQRKPQEPEWPVKVVTWWQAESEKDAWTALISEHLTNFKNDKQPTEQTLKNGQTTAEGLREDLANGISLPDMFQVNSGESLFWWLGRPRGDLVRIHSLSGRVTQVDGGTFNWQSAFHPDLLDQISYRNDQYCVPVGIHRLNTLFFNITTLRAHNIDIPQADSYTLEQFRADCSKIHPPDGSQGEDAGTSPSVAPIVVSGLDRWTVSTLVYDTLLPAFAKGDDYLRFWSGAADPNATPSRAPWLTQALQELVDWKKNGWIDDNYSTLNWRAAAERLINPAASTNRPAFFIMGDWGRGELEYLRRTLKDPDEFGSVPFPHPEGVVEDTYVFAADCFTIVRGGGNEIGASRLVDTFASLAAQLAYSKYKGSIPARMHEGSGADIDPTVEAEWKLFNADSTRRVPATSGLVPFELAGQYDDSAYRLLAEKSIDASLRFWRDWYLELQVKRGN